MPRRVRHGYTLIELVVSMAILGIVGSVLANIMMGQQRFFQRTVEQMSVRRELRTAMNLLPTELRGVSSAAGDITDFTTSSVTFRSTLGASIVCAKTSTTSIDLPPTNTARMITSNWYVQPAVGDTVFAVRNDSSGTKGDFWTAHRITAIATATSYCVGSVYVDSTRDVGKTRYRLTVTPALPDSVVAGSGLRFTRSGKYTLVQQASGRYYLSRSEYLNGAWSTAVPVSGPYRAPTSGGLSLSFYDSTGVVVSTVANATKIARIDLVLRAQGLSSSGTFGSATTTVIDSVALRVALRNRR